MADELTRLARVETHLQLVLERQQRHEVKLDTLLGHYHMQRGVVKFGHLMSGVAGGLFAAAVAFWTGRHS